MSQAMVVLADGFEELEAIAIIDILRRAKFKVLVTGLDSIEVTSCRGVNVIADSSLAEEEDHEFDIVILPGGEPGTTNLQNSTQLAAVLQKQHAAKKWIAALCSAPRILSALGILEGRHATSFPSAEPFMTQCIYETKAVVVDDHIITGRGPAAALRFAYTIVEKLADRETASDIKKAMLYDLR
jgi:4-methyl-5(b-hydroxyethyl)-thiazole monophosphate biosynthesis